MDLKVKGQEALVTGGTKCIGPAIAETLSDKGCDIALCAGGITKRIQFWR